MNTMTVSRWLTVVSVIFLLTTPGFADKHKKEEVAQFITETEAKLNSIKNNSSAELVKNEIVQIETHIAASRKFLNGRDIDLAFDEISMGALYFQMIDARIDLQKATDELNETKDKFSK
jgi:hypothetical protein